MNIIERLLSKKDYVPGYNLLYPIAKGTMSTVYYAEDKSANAVAIKIISKESMKIVEKLNKYFRNGKSEGEVTMEFDHPNIVKVLGYGIEHKKEYIIEEYIKGALLSEDIPRAYEKYRKNPLPLLQAMAEALKHIHSKGYIHRDVCPQNIFMCEDGSYKLFDFGLTVSIESAKKIRGNRTGRVSYLAPELLKRELTDQRTDIYSFGVLMYELLTLKRPYIGKTNIERLLQILNSAPVDPKQYYEDIPEPFYQILTKAMHKDKDNRYNSFDEVIQELRRAKNLLNL